MSGRKGTPSEPSARELQRKIAQLEHDLAVERGQYDPWQSRIEKWLRDNRMEVGDQRHPTKSILTGAVGLQPKQFDRHAYTRLLKIMTRMGWTKTILEISGVRHRGYRRSSYE